MSRPVFRRIPVPLLAVALLASACGTPDSSASPTTSERPSTTRSTTTLSTTTLPPTTTVPPTTVADTTEPFDPEEIIAADEPVRGPATTRTGTAAPSPGYTGLLGSLAIDDVLFGAPADPPVSAPGAAPLTGVPVWIPNRPAVIVKVDNSQAARPQRGLNSSGVGTRFRGGQAAVVLV